MEVEVDAVVGDVDDDDVTVVDATGVFDILLIARNLFKLVNYLFI